VSQGSISAELDATVTRHEGWLADVRTRHIRDRGRSQLVRRAHLARQRLPHLPLTPPPWRWVWSRPAPTRTRPAGPSSPSSSAHDDRGPGPRHAPLLRHPPGRGRRLGDGDPRLLGHESLNTSQGYIDSTASEQRAAPRSNRTYQTLESASSTPPPGGTDGRPSLWLHAGCTWWVSRNESDGHRFCATSGGGKVWGVGFVAGSFRCAITIGHRALEPRTSASEIPRHRRGCGRRCSRG
jgi:hypothetical protein